MDNTQQAQLSSEVTRLHDECLSVIMATKSGTGMPHASYTPFVYLDQNFYILIAGITLHTQHLLVNPELSIMLIEDESKAKNIYARPRLNYDAMATKIGKESEEYKTALNALRERAGKTVELLDGLNDFSMFRLTPNKGTLVIGFGKAYVFDPQKPFDATQLTDKNVSELQ